MSNRRSREARALMAETGWSYTRALREVTRQEDIMSEHGEGPATETRGGENPDWPNAEPGKALQEKPDTLPDPPPDWERGNWAGEE